MTPYNSSRYQRLQDFTGEIRNTNLQGELERSEAHYTELTSNIINLGLALEQANKKITKLEIEIPTKRFG